MMLFNPCCSGVMYVTHSLRNISLAWKSENEVNEIPFISFLYVCCLGFNL
ncbi:hypothetical protein Lalb_Chr19g0136751 [Lupinus albus]|uniref:Uncharacterized protein n=1 Tax=Lupinus albus TaxID=3870 RepID=A0A6A4NM23_LUPAL|nr:hypothetical protein Lalb_Chr19g0136751 [Lupinus albus]